MKISNAVSRVSVGVLISIFSFVSLNFSQDVAAANPASNFGQATAAASRRVCDHGHTAGLAFCNAHIKVDPSGRPQASAGPAGLSPQQLRAAYNLGAGKTSVIRTIAIISAYDHPTIAADLKTYSTQFGLTQMANCAVSSGTPTRPCFQKVDQNGGTAYPAFNSAWATEIALDVETVHAICENCNILLVEASSNSYNDLFAALDKAASMGASVISNSYSSNEWSGETAYDSHLNLPGIAVTFSTGDAGFGPQYPAASPYVTAVGGTTLNMNGNSYVSETAWAGSGSGCSNYEIKPAFQTDALCANRTIADVSAVADPATGAAVYNSANVVKGKGAWYIVGGTSLAAPLIAGIYALAGVPSGSAANSLPYSSTSALRDITSGNNGFCGNAYLCTATAGYDGPTGLGTPNGFSAF
jgi:subtilase family serine protease